MTAAITASGPCSIQTDSSPTSNCVERIVVGGAERVLREIADRRQHRRDHLRVGHSARGLARTCCSSSPVLR